MEFYQCILTIISLLYTKIQLISLSHLTPASKPSYWTKFCRTKEVYANQVQMTSNFARTCTFVPHFRVTTSQSHLSNHFTSVMPPKFHPEAVLDKTDQSRPIRCKPV